MDKPSQTELLKPTSEIVSAHISNNSVSTPDLTKHIQEIMTRCQVFLRAF
jgi:predicted transcriptional regulator